MMVDDEEGPPSTVNNLWSSICDVNACLEAITNHQSLFVSHPGGMSGPLPSPSTSAIAGIQPPEKFKVLNIPSKSEHLAFDVSVAVLQLFIGSS